MEGFDFAAPSGSASPRRTRRASCTTRTTSCGSRSRAWSSSSGSPAATSGCATRASSRSCRGARALPRPARFDDRLLVHSRCLDVRGARFRFEYAVERDGALIAEGWTAHGTVDAKTLRPTRTPQWLSAAIAARGRLAVGVDGGGGRRGRRRRLRLRLGLRLRAEVDDLRRRAVARVPVASDSSFPSGA